MGARQETHKVEGTFFRVMTDQSGKHLVED